MLRVLMVLVLPGVAFGYRLTILHTNDMHTRIEEISSTTATCHHPGSCYGGFARLAAAAADIRDNNTLFLNAGDNFQGTPYYFVFKWKILAHLIDKLGIDVMSLGNHEFDDGLEGLIPYLRAVKTPSIAANIDYSSAPEITFGTNLRPSWSKVVGGVNVTIIGYITPTTTYLAKPRPLKFFDEIPVLQKLAKEAKEQGAKIVIALGHSGFEKDIQIARDVPDVDVVVGGHSDTFLYTGPQPDLEEPQGEYPYTVVQPSGKKVPVVQAYGYTKYLGHLVLVFDEKFNIMSATGNPILLDSSKRQDPKLLEDIRHWKQNMSMILDANVAKSLVDLGGNCRDSECNLGNLITDAIVHYHAQKLTAGEGNHTQGWTNAPISVLNGGTIRSSLSLNDTMGQLSVGDLMTVIPFDNPIVRVVISGQLLKEVLENSVAEYDIEKMAGPGSFLQVSGIRVKYDLSQLPGSRVSAVDLLCGSCSIPSFSPLDLKQNYSILTSQYVVEGGDKFDQFLDPEVKVELLHWNDLEAVRNYLVKRQPLHPPVEGRIIFEGAKEDSYSDSSTMTAGYLPGMILTIIVVFRDNFF